MSTKGKYKYSNEELIEAAKPFKHRGQWKRADYSRYQAALWRGIMDKCCAHMVPAANPYHGDYVIYAYEFTDRHAYVGLTFRSVERQQMHRVRGPVHAHAKVCQEYAFKIVERDLATPQLAALAEQKWTEAYRIDGWTLLNSFKAGGTGSVLKTKWTKESVVAEAKKYQSKQEWIDNSQFTYRLAKREGWFNEASAHMPARVLGVGLGIKRSVVTRQKLQKAAQRRAADPAWRKAHSRALKGRKLTQAHRDAIGRGVKAVNS